MYPSKLAVLTCDETETHGRAYVHIDSKDDSVRHLTDIQCTRHLQLELDADAQVFVARRCVQGAE